MSRLRGSRDAWHRWQWRRVRPVRRAQGKKDALHHRAYEIKGESPLGIPNFDDGAKLAVKDLKKKGWTRHTTSASRRSATVAASQEQAFLAVQRRTRTLDRSDARATSSSRWARRWRPPTCRRSRCPSPSEGVKNGPSGGDNIFLLRPLNEQTYSKLLEYICTDLKKQLKLKDEDRPEPGHDLVRPDGRAR